METLAERYLNWICGSAIQRTDRGRETEQGLPYIHRPGIEKLLWRLRWVHGWWPTSMPMRAGESD